MSDQIDVASELAKIAKLNGDFRRNYGTVLGAFLYLCSITAARRASHWGLIVALATAILTLVAKHGWSHVAPF